MLPGSTEFKRGCRAPFGLVLRGFCRKFAVKCERVVLGARLVQHKVVAVAFSEIESSDTVLTREEFV